MEKMNQGGKDDSIFSNFHGLILKKIIFFQDLIQKTISRVQLNKINDIIGVSEVNNCLQNLLNLNSKLMLINTSMMENNKEEVINILQTINNELSSIFKIYGTDSLDDLLSICFGTTNNMYNFSDIEKSKFELLRKYFHPLSYRLLSNKEKEPSIIEDFHSIIDKKIVINSGDDINLNDQSPNLDCIIVSLRVQSFYLKVHGIQVIIHNAHHKKHMVVTGIIDDIVLDFVTNTFITTQKVGYDKMRILIEENKRGYYDNFIKVLTLKDFCVFTPSTILSKFNIFYKHLESYRQKSISQITKDFIAGDLYLKRTMIIELLIKTEYKNNSYLAYLLYDLLSNDNNNNVDTREQTMLLDNCPWTIKESFKDALNYTIQYTNDISNFDTAKIPLEQQICLLKTNDSVKEKALQKLKEIKAKAEDSGFKARQYLDGLLKIPFQIYRSEPILSKMKENKKEVIHYLNDIEDKSSIEFISNITNINEQVSNWVIIDAMDKLNKSSINVYLNDKKLYSYIKNKSKKELENFTKNVNMNLPVDTIIQTKGKKKEDLIKDLCYIFMKYKDNAQLTKLIDESVAKDIVITNQSLSIHAPFVNYMKHKFQEVNTYMNGVKNILDKSIYGHDKAKQQIEQIIGQWINGEADGYCFGFEGPAGVGKTSLAKRGLANCLCDAEGQSRPFAMIQMGGDSNGSTIHGHNYTYVGSIWGSIVQILMDKKCMNPIIFIDEVDKISKTENGKEIVGILTHLLDSTQNDCFQDKYFSGIDIDLSKALFILSYNDPDSIDRILLDRVHRIRFSSLSLDEKIVICKSHLLLDIYKKMGLENMISIDDDVLKFIIEEYTAEAGVRKLKEILFEIIGGINIDVLKNGLSLYTIPLHVTIEDIKTKYFKDKQRIKHYKIHEDNKIGIINGLWANALGKGGVIPIQSKWRPSNKFLDLQLTGMQGDVMKESMNVALTLAWNLTNKEQRQKKQSSIQGVHIHCPEGATPKDGPSAGTAITVSLYSLFNDKKIKNNIAITGEITLDGKVTEIGGLDLKILGGIKAGVTTFLYPEENIQDFDKFLTKYKDTELLQNISFHSVAHIDEVLELVFE